MEDPRVAVMSGDTEVLSCTSVCNYCEWYEVDSCLTKSKLTVLTINVRSFAGKYAEICTHQVKLKIYLHSCLLMKLAT